MTEFFTELKRRHMFRVAAAYAVVAWVLLQVVNNLAPGLNLPNWAVTFVIVLLAVGFPIALLFCWIQHLPSAEGTAPAAKTAKLDWLLIGALVLVIALVSYQQFVPSPGSGTTRAPQGGAIAIAVLPFANVSGDASQEFFSDGMTDEIIAALARIPSLQVVARTSAFRFKGERNDMRAIGRELNAQYLIDGSVRRAGNRVRITAQLVQADNGVGIWTDSYDRELTDVFAIQEDIATTIAASLQVPLRLQQGETLVRDRTRDLELYDQYLRARALRRASGPGIAQAIDMLERVVASDPTFAPAWALLATAYDAVPLNVPEGRTGSLEEQRRIGQVSREKAEKAAQEAIRLDPRNAVAYASLGNNQADLGQWAAADDLVRQALQLDPNEPEVLWAYGEVLRSTGRLQEALRVTERLRTLEPLEPVYAQRVANFLQTAGENRASIPILEALPADLGGGYNRNVFLARAYAVEGRFGDAANTLLAMRTNLVSRESIEEAARLIRSAPTKVADPESLRLFESAILSFVYSYVGADDRFMDVIEGSRDTSPDLTALLPTTWLPLYAPLRKTERLKEFMRSVGLVDYWRARGWPDLCRPVGADDFVCD